MTTNSAVYIVAQNQKTQLIEAASFDDAVKWLLYYRHWFPREEFLIE